MIWTGWSKIILRSWFSYRLIKDNPETRLMKNDPEILVLAMIRNDPETLVLGQIDEKSS